jgi:hypothetical protein
MPSSTASTNVASDRPRARRRPRSERELLEREERLALAAIVGTARRLVGDLSDSAGLPEKAREHPLAASVIASVGGYVAGRGAWHAALALIRSIGPLLGARDQVAQACARPAAPPGLWRWLRLVGHGER